MKADPGPLFVDRLATPVGELVIVADGEGCLRAVRWMKELNGLDRLVNLDKELNVSALEPCLNPGGSTEAIARYFEGELHAIDSLRVRADGTPFQREVWDALRTIPCGQTTSYSALARQIGRDAAVRAVGLANGANPVAVVVPCHRVIGAGGALTGYGGGLERKRWLLAHEGCVSGPLFR